jgi:hypothetical protein
MRTVIFTAIKGDTMSKLSKRVDALGLEMAQRFEYKNTEIAELQSSIGILSLSVATLQKQMSCDCSNFEVVCHRYSFRTEFQQVNGTMELVYKRKCLSCGLETPYTSKEAAMKDKDALLKAEIDRLTTERKSLKEDK